VDSDPNSGNRKYVTVKINVNTLTEDFQKGRREIAEKLYSANPKHPGYSHVRFMLSTFKVRGKHGDHLCIVYDVLREPIDECMLKFPGRRFNNQRLRILLPALLQGLDYLHTDCRVVHTDLKADNVMMGLGDPTTLDKFVQRELDHPSPRKSPDNHGRIIYKSCSDFSEAISDAVISSAKITDIGLAAWGDEKNTRPIQSNAFMAPEVILGAGWSYPADIWNFGVMLWDLFETQGLFDAISTNPDSYRPEQHLGLMISLLGPPPLDFLKRCTKAKLYFDAEGNFKYPNKVKHDCCWDYSISHWQGEEKELFIDFARKMLKWVPEERWTAKQLLEHPFLTKEREYVPTPALSRASTASIQSMMTPPRQGTPPTSAPMYNHSPKTLPQQGGALPARLFELGSSPSDETLHQLDRVPTNENGHLERISTNGSRLERVPTNGSRLERVSTNGSISSLRLPSHVRDEKSASTSHLPRKPTMETLTESRSETDVEVPVRKHTVNKSNQQSQDLIDSILNRKPHPHNSDHDRRDS
jgi:serine/threonine-protein kinase SRPK3